MEAQENDLSNEAAALADILTWSVDLPAWQRDTLRRLSNQNKLQVADITALVAICKAARQESRSMRATWRPKRELHDV